MSLVLDIVKALYNVQRLSAEHVPESEMKAQQELRSAYFLIKQLEKEELDKANQIPVYRHA